MLFHLLFDYLLKIKKFSPENTIPAMVLDHSWLNDPKECEKLYLGDNYNSDRANCSHRFQIPHRSIRLLKRRECNSALILMSVMVNHFHVNIKIFKPEIYIWHGDWLSMYFNIITSIVFNKTSIFEKSIFFHSVLTYIVPIISFLRQDIQNIKGRLTLLLSY